MGSAQCSEWQEGGKGGTEGRRADHRQPAQKSSLSALPVFPFLLLGRVHELICWQFQDKGLLDCKLKDLEEKPTGPVTLPGPGDQAGDWAGAGLEKDLGFINS